MKILAVGDIHTKLWIIAEAEQLLADYDGIVFVGDYADDWNASPMKTIKTWQALRRLQNKNLHKVNVLMGNHDYIYTNYTKTISSGYNHTTQAILDDPENKGLKSWLHDLPTTGDFDGIIYSHAGLTIDYREGDDLWDDSSPLWARPWDVEYLDVPQVFGHTPSQTCHEIKKNIWCIDTFSTLRDGIPVGDHTTLEIVDGKHFKKIQFKR